jgi:hypothetical protein
VCVHNAAGKSAANISQTTRVMMALNSLLSTLMNKVVQHGHHHNCAQPFTIHICHKKEKSEWF